MRRSKSIFKGFAGGGFHGGQGLPKKMAVAAQVPGSFLIPDGSEAFPGFTSTQKPASTRRRSRTSRSSATRLHFVVFNPPATTSTAAAVELRA
jgi:hypothetical protein